MTTNFKRQTFVDRSKPAGKMGFAIAGVPCFADTFVQGGSLVLRMKFCTKTPRHRTPKKSYVSPCDTKVLKSNGQKYKQDRKARRTFSNFGFA
jgi:hypothetical protein